MRQRYGLLAPMFLNYDFTFLAILLAPEEERAALCRGRCHANPLMKKDMCTPSPALETAADESVILTWWQLRDKVRDSGVLAGIPARILTLLLCPAYQKAARTRPGFAKAVQEGLERLDRLEQEECASMDEAADAFAVLLQAAAPESGEEMRDRPLAQLLYHMGRWIYLLDAQDDLEEDCRAGRYNPIKARFGTEGDPERVRLTLTHSQNLMCAAAQLMDFGCRGPLVDNILYLGLPLIQKAVFDGSWRRLQKQKIWRNNT